MHVCRQGPLSGNSDMQYVIFSRLAAIFSFFFLQFHSCCHSFFAATTASNSTHGSAPATVFHSRNIDIAQYPCQHPSFLPLLLAIIIVFA